MPEKNIPLSITEQLAYSTVKIDVSYKNGSGSGTGFFFQLKKTGNTHIPVIITNKHVIEGGIKGNFHLTLATPDGRPDTGNVKSIELVDFGKYWIHHRDKEVDLAIMLIAPLLNAAKKNGVSFFYIAFDKSIIPTESEINDFNYVEDILMVGYPIGMEDTKNYLPIFRRGITASYYGNDFNGKKEFLIDAPIFPGSSGSPVILYNAGSYMPRSGGLTVGSRMKLLGILWGGPQHTIDGEIRIVNIPVKAIPKAYSKIPINLGLVIKSERILDFNDYFK